MSPEQGGIGEDPQATVLDAKDTFAYGVGLVLTGGALSLAYPSWLTVGLSSLAVLGLWLSFAVRHGLSAHGLIDVALALLTYPLLFVRRLVCVRTRLLLGVMCFASALYLESLIAPMLDGTVWVKPLPFALFLGLHFCLIAAYRLLIFVHHLRDIERVEAFLRLRHYPVQSPANVSLWVTHGLTTGLLTHASLLVIPTLWWGFVSPSLLLEGLLLVCWFVFTENPWVLEIRQRELIGFANEDHAEWHADRTLFVLFHAHHHDAIPSGLIASHGVGLLEAMHRTLLSGDWLGPCSHFCWNQTKVIREDIEQHQFIPGVFPGALKVVERRNHHAVHHLGGVLPLGTGLSGVTEPVDVDYEPKNPISEWFLDAVDAQEGLSPELREDYLSIDLNGDGAAGAQR